MDLADRSAERRDRAGANRPFGRRSPAGGRSLPRQAVPRRALRLDLLRPDEKPEPALVRHGGLRKPRKGEALRSEGAKAKIATRPQTAGPFRAGWRCVVLGSSRQGLLACIEPSRSMYFASDELDIFGSRG